MLSSFQWHPFWDLLGFHRRHDPPGRFNGQVRGATERRYPIRLLRYWFMDHLLRREASVLDRPLEVCEVGVGGGDLLAFVSGATATKPGVHPAWVKSWDAVSKRIDRSRLAELGYSACYEADIEKPLPALPRQYDALVLLHVLEHLRSPESALARLLPYVRPGGLVIGGCPTLPDILRPVRERQLQKRAEPFGHVSVISTKRMKRAAKQHRLRVELITGAYFMRATGSKLEDSRTWLRFNLVAGVLMTGWVGEIYWSLRKGMPSERPAEQGLG
jgi:2-polyprenyl-3-methyl-5-hydroxy-6-metoxy-1,4-benzoquinol methylase